VAGNGIDASAREARPMYREPELLWHSTDQGSGIRLTDLRRS